MRITINHLSNLTPAEVDRLNDPVNGGWDSEPKFTRFANIRMNPDAADVADTFANGGYDIIADLEVPDLNAAYHASNNINSSWLENEEVTSKDDALEGARSTSVGDVLSNPDTGEYWLVMPLDFENITAAINAAYRNRAAGENA